MSYELRVRPVKVRGRVVRVPVEASPGLGFSLDPFALATAVQSGANKLQSNLQTASGWLTSGVQKIDAAAQTTTNTLNRVGAGVQGAARGGIAAAGTGDATSGLTLAALTTKPALVIGGVLLAMYVFTRHPGHRGL